MADDLRAFYCRPLAEVVADLQAGGNTMSYQEIAVGVMAAQNAFGCLSDEDAHALGSMEVTRVEAPPSDPNNPEATDPSPNALPEGVETSGP